MSAATPSAAVRACSASAARAAAESTARCREQRGSSSNAASWACSSAVPAGSSFASAALPDRPSPLGASSVELSPDGPSPDGHSSVESPSAEPAWLDDEAEQRAQSVIDVIRAVRNIRAEFNVEPARHVEAYVIADAAGSTLAASQPLIVALARVQPLHIVSQPGDAPQEAVVTAVLKDSQVVLPMGGMFDLEAERQRLQKQIAAAETDVERLRSKLANQEFLA